MWNISQVNHRLPSIPLDISRWRTVHRDHAKGFSLPEEQVAKLGPADAGRVLQHSFKYRLKLAGRAADRTQHLRRRGLLLQRFPQLLEQPNVLDRDHGLAGKIGDELDLFVGERKHLLPVDGDAPHQLLLLEHRHHQKRARTSSVDQRNEWPIASDVSGLCREVDDMNDLLRAGEPAERDVWLR